VPLEIVTEKMSKSRGNVVNPDEVVARFGTDAMRLYEMFMGPIEKGAPWSDEAIPGLHRFLQRAHRLVTGEDGDLAPGAGTDDQARLTAETIAGVTDDVEQVRFNTAISKLMVFVRDIAKDAPLPRDAADAFVRLLCPFAPHLAEELWARLGNSPCVCDESWPTWDAAMLVDDTVEIPVQIMGKVRSHIVVPSDATKDDLEKAALADPRIAELIEGKTVRKVVVVPGRLVNVVAN
jgi:leucyl-tRNA synthetase